MRERRRVRTLAARLVAQLSQVVVEEATVVPLPMVLPITGKPPKGCGRISKATLPLKIWSPKRSSLNRQLSTVWGGMRRWS